MIGKKYIENRELEIFARKYHMMSDEDKFFQVLSELVDLYLEPIDKPKTNAGHFAQKISFLYNTDVIIIKEGIPKSGSIALVYWKSWNNFSFIKFKNNRSIYTIDNHNFDVNFTPIMIEKFYRIMIKGY